VTTFAYVALEPSGSRKEGVVEAKDRETAIALVSAQGRFVLEINEHKAATAQTVLTSSRKKVSRSDLALFARRLADLAAAGLPLDRVLQVIAEQSENAALQDVANNALEDVRTGIPVSQALAKYPKYFPPVYTETLRAGEASGQFAEVATRLADFQEKEVARRSQISAAMIYPTILTCVAVLVIIFLLTFVVPRMSGIFQGLGNDLPVTTKMLLGTTTFLTANAVPIVIGLVIAFIAYRSWAATEAGAFTRDRLMMRIPVVGKVIEKAVMSRYARVLGTLVYGGVPILEALQLAGLAAGNRVFLKTSERVADDVRDGASIHGAMEDARNFPPVLTHMVAIGEETGDLPKMLDRVSNSLDFEVDNSVRRLTSMIEPLIMVVMGAFVGFVVISVLLPIFQAQDLVK
jgi:type IV pilus assembly protein PilC